LTPDSQKTNEGAHYLRQLKTQTGGDPSSADLSSGASTAGQTYSGKERRRNPRFRCAGSAEFKAEGSEVRMWGTLTDVSLHGCYVEMSTTFPVGTKVDLVLDALGIRVCAKGTVRVSYPFLGMGLCLTDLEPGQQTQLEQLLNAVAGQSSGPDPALTREVGGGDSLAPGETTALLAELKRFFDSKPILSREEYRHIVKRCRRS
jgi:hypothetical protein